MSENEERTDIDRLVSKLVLSDDVKVKSEIFDKILQQAEERGIFPASIHHFYRARGRGEFGGFTVPAINLRTLTYDLARAIFRIARSNRAGAFILEIARSEISYTAQRPIEYAGVCLAAAIREGWKGPVFIQGDHFQVNAKKYLQNPDEEIEMLNSLIREALAAGFYNIDIDSSTLVDLSKQGVKEQQRLNFSVCAAFTRFIRLHQPEGVEVSVGGEIGEIGRKNTTPEELEAFMEGYQEELGSSLEGISKISVQTGTSHGGVVLPDGSIARVNVDFETLRTLSRLAREKYTLAGAVQHGASTLPENMFHKFPEVETAEIHLATQFQNMVYESQYFPDELRKRMYAWLKENHRNEWNKGETESQFIYKTRKRALGEFKTEIMRLKPEIRAAIAAEVEAKIAFLFTQLNLANTMALINRYVKHE
ncbi:MAG: class II fructose-bisphosphate aldolase [Methanophagales archaeon]|nr:class II fructose-bisphosphate aldolase [Methanophagales archaeon]MCW3140393.1 class II fructose-bisphosphate aldolase [Methanophagales archaeon]MCW7070474.1 class II fructose-bisphosphate aldolase [Methanophagales archaeon]MCW7074031.1 class II fructose-bisphosphate aldolase [Methanophagales archaeon]